MRCCSLITFLLLSFDFPLQNLDCFVSFKTWFGVIWFSLDFSSQSLGKSLLFNSKFGFCTIVSNTDSWLHCVILEYDISDCTFLEILICWWTNFVEFVCSKCWLHSKQTYKLGNFKFKFLHFAANDDFVDLRIYWPWFFLSLQKLHVR